MSSESLLPTVMFVAFISAVLNFITILLTLFLGRHYSSFLSFLLRLCMLLNVFWFCCSLFSFRSDIFSSNAGLIVAWLAFSFFVCRKAFKRQQVLKSRIISD